MTAPRIVALFVGTAVTAAWGQTTTWINPAGGVWHDAANWSDGVPVWTAPIRSARFSLATPVSVVVDQDLAGASPLVIDGAGLDLVLGAQSLRGETMIIGGGSGRTTVVVSGPGQLRIGNSWFGIELQGPHGAELLANNCNVSAGFFGMQSGTEARFVNGSVLAIPIFYGSAAVAAGATLTFENSYFASSCQVFGTLRLLGSRWDCWPSFYPTAVDGLVEFSGPAAGGGIERLPGLGTVRLVAGSNLFVGVLSTREIEVRDLGTRLEYGRIASTNAFGIAEGAVVSVIPPQLSPELPVGDVQARTLTVNSYGKLERANEVRADLIIVRDGGELEAERVVSPFLTVEGSFAGVATHLFSGNAVVRDGASLRAGSQNELAIASASCCQSRSKVRVLSGATVTLGVGHIVGAELVVGDHSNLEGSVVHVGGTAPAWTGLEAQGMTASIVLSHGGLAELGSLSILREHGLGVVQGGGSLAAEVSLAGVLRADGMSIAGSVQGQIGGCIELAAGTGSRALTVAGSCELSQVLMIVGLQRPADSGEEIPLLHAAAGVAIGELALPTLPAGLEWTVTQTPTDLSIAAAPAMSRCRPSIDTLSSSMIDGYVDDPITLATSVFGPIISMRWHKDGEPLSDDAIYSGTSSQTLTINSSQPRNLARYHLIATGPCGMTASNAIDASIRCGGDFNQDFVVDGDDVIAFFGPWDSADIAADWNHDGGVDGDDVIGFFEKWDSGC